MWRVRKSLRPTMSARTTTFERSPNPSLAALALSAAFVTRMMHMSAGQPACAADAGAAGSTSATKRLR
eukprot:CAMPEP_0183379872 /NCGR_PEP_ID=MMETSP0164_2-20130417/125648_1 /TAXON_ID=221442 /ORGANISM="Coccolithus pelagicus ssp braarudi, Strain PLY182g" /LENGTH=67 /DNA_ID=CAMNT_0025557461 /DNA_START=113 /DNA_END=316 /DNA_ORIENTATION=+